jgi:hypothetical protein
MAHLTHLIIPFSGTIKMAAKHGVRSMRIGGTRKRESVTPCPQGVGVTDG